MDVRFKRGSCILVLEGAAITAVRCWKFSPARIGESAMDTNVDMSNRFRPENNNKQELLYELFSHSRPDTITGAGVAV